MLASAGMLMPGLGVIHGTALQPEDFDLLTSKGVGLIWSPRSNDELYGGTTNIAAALRSGVNIAIAPDWSPTGSAGMLQELNYVSARYSKVFTNSDLIKMATSVPARIVRIGDRIGKIAPGMFADLTVVRSHTADPFASVVQASPADVLLVVVGGKALYGDRDLLSQIVPAKDLNNITVCGAPKSIVLASSGAAFLGEDLATLQKKIDDVLKRFGEALSGIECD